MRDLAAAAGTARRRTRLGPVGSRHPGRSDGRAAARRRRRPRGAPDRTTRPRLVRRRVGLSRRQARPHRQGRAGRRHRAGRGGCPPRGRARDAGGDGTRGRGIRSRHALVLGSAAGRAPCGSGRGSSSPRRRRARCGSSPARRSPRSGCGRLIALQRQARGELLLYPPTWVTLHGLADADDAASALAGARLRGIQTFATQVRKGPGGPVLLWGEDAEYDGERPDAASGPRHRLEFGATPWVYTRHD